MPIDGVVSCGGRIDLASAVLEAVGAPSLYLVGGTDTEVLARTREAINRFSCEKEFSVVPNAGHLFEGPGERDGVAAVAAPWFAETLRYGWTSTPIQWIVERVFRVILHFHPLGTTAPVDTRRLPTTYHEFR